MAPHEREQAALARPLGIQFPPAGQEVVVNQTDYVKAVGHNLGLRKMFAHHGTVAGR